MWAAFGLGATLLALIYLIPYLGFIMWGGLTLWGIGAVILVIFSRRRGETRTVPPVVPAGRGFDSPPVNDGWANPSSGETVSSVVPADLILPTATGLTGVSSTIPALSYVTSSGPASASGPGVTSMPEVSRPTPPPLGASERVQDLWALPRVGLGPRLLALLMDVSVLGLLSMVLPNWIHRIPYADGLFVLGYFAGFWMSHGATIGGLLIGLRVIRLDGRAIDWQVAIVRSLSSFLSLFSAGLGEFWCAWDRDQQTWQDKLAGTVVVKEARLRSLI